MNYIDNILKELSSIYRVPKPNYYTNCTSFCPSSSQCSYAACYNHNYDAICFKSSKPREDIISHEYGHYLWHSKRGYKGHLNYDDARNCEAYANTMQNYWREAHGMSRLGEELDIFDTLLPLVATTGAFVGSILGAWAIKELSKSLK